MASEKQRQAAVGRPVVVVVDPLHAGEECREVVDHLPTVGMAVHVVDEMVGDVAEGHVLVAAP